MEKTADFSGLTYGVFNSGDVTFSFTYPDNVSDVNLDTMLTQLQSILNDTEKVRNGKKQLVKDLARIAHHRDQLQDALGSIVQLYVDSTTTATPKPRKTAAYRARYEMLESMPDKWLREYGSRFMPDEIDNYILPDDRPEIIARLCDILADDSQPAGVSGK